MTRARGILLLPLLAGIVVAGCGTGRRTRARVDHPTPLTGVLREGEIAYMHFCNACHPGGAAGLGPSLNDKPLPGAAIALQVRQGLGAMPAFDDAVIDDPTLETIVQYMDWLRGLQD